MFATAPAGGGYYYCFLLLLFTSVLVFVCELWRHASLTDVRGGPSQMTLRPSNCPRWQLGRKKTQTPPFHVRLPLPVSGVVQNLRIVPVKSPEQHQQLFTDETIADSSI